MFKKRALKGISRSKPVAKLESSDSESEDELADITLKKRKRLDAPTKAYHDKPSSNDHNLTKTELATKVDILNQELIDKERAGKELEKVDQKETLVDGIYKRQSGYTKFINPKSKMDGIGPKKASSNIRSTTTFDFQRDVCKDYKQTGFCGYGDSCKFLHARDDFKAGWKLNREWDLNAKDKEDSLEKELKDVPFKCAICKKNYKRPVKTSCNHYFCEGCFLIRSRKTHTCFICGNNTNGAALPAKNLLSVLKD